MQAEKSQHPGPRIIPETLYPRVGIFRSALETDDRFYLPVQSTLLRQTIYSEDVVN